MKKYMYLCLAALSIGIFASCKAKKGVEATFSDLDGSWNIILFLSASVKFEN